MHDFAPEKVEDFISDLHAVNPEHAGITERVRDLFTEENGKLHQDIKYGGLVFFLEGELIGGVFPYKRHLSIEFSNGVNFTDPSSVLEGNGRQRRHLKIYTAEDISAKNARYFVKQAVVQNSDTR